MLGGLAVVSFFSSPLFLLNLFTSHFSFYIHMD